MKIEELIEFVKGINVLTEMNFFTRGTIIDFISGHSDNWILILKALLIKNPKTVISKHYLLDKLRLMQNNPEKAHMFLDHQGLTIYKALQNIPKTIIRDLNNR